MTLRRVQIIAALCALLALVTLACKAGKPPAQEPQKSPWLRVSGPPPAQAAIGYLTNGKTSPSLATVTWTSDGESERVSTAALLVQPQPALIPVLTPLALPAAFGLTRGRALVWGQRGWAWASLRDGLEFRSFDDLLRAAAEQSQRAGERKGRSGWSLHKDRLLVVPAQPLRAEPLDTAPVLAELPAEWDAKTATFPHSSTEVPEPETLVLGASTTLPPVVKVAELRGDWAQVALPEPDRLIVGNGGAGLLVKWQAKAAGWVKLKKAGPLEGTALNVWTTRAFGIGGVDY